MNGTTDNGKMYLEDRYPWHFPLSTINSEGFYEYIEAIATKEEQREWMDKNGAIFFTLPYRGGRMDLLRYCLDAGANPDLIVKQDGRNMLMYTLIESEGRNSKCVGNTEAAQLLLDYGANINAVTKNGTALDEVVKHDGLWQWLLDKGAVPTKNTLKAYLESENQYRYGLFRHIIRSCLDAGTKPSLDALILDAAQDDWKAVREGINRGKLSEKNETNVVFLSAGFGDVETMQLLAEHIDLLTYTDGWNKLVHIAAEYGNIPVLEYLIELGVDINNTFHEDGDYVIPRNAGSSYDLPIHIAVRNNQQETVEYLLNCGVPDRIDLALSYAIEYGEEDLFWLVESYVPNREKTLYLNAIDTAILFGREDIIRHYLDQDRIIINPDREKDKTSDGSTYPDFFGNAILFNKPDMVKLFLERGADPNGGDPQGWGYGWPLLTAAEYGSSESALLLMQWGADPNAVNQRADPMKGRIFQEAVKNGDIRVIKAMMEYGMETDVLTMALYQSVRYSARITGLLLEAGADADSRLYDEKSPYEFAVSEGNVAVIELLQKYCDGSAP